MIDAAEIERTLASPPTTVRTGIVSSRPLVAVDEDDLRLLRQPLDGAPHRQQRGAQDVDRVDLGDARRGDAEAERALPDHAVEPLALLGA